MQKKNGAELNQVVWAKEARAMWALKHPSLVNSNTFCRTLGVAVECYL